MSHIKVAMIAICFACGREKKDGPLTRCSKCSVKPVSKKDKINSIALSNQCLSEKNLKIGSQYIRQHRKIPKIHDEILAKATKLIESVTDSATDQSQSFDFSNSFFDFQGFSGEQGETVTVHAIGKPVKRGVNEETKISNLGNEASTYQVFQWEIGKDISFDEADLHMDDEGNMYIWYRYIGSGWSWKPVPMEEFMRLKGLEG